MGGRIVSLVPALFACGVVALHYQSVDFVMTIEIIAAVAAIFFTGFEIGDRHGEKRVKRELARKISKIYEAYRIMRRNKFMYEALVETARQQGVKPAPPNWLKDPLRELDEF